MNESCLQLRTSELSNNNPLLEKWTLGLKVYQDHNIFLLNMIKAQNEFSLFKLEDNVF